jgi:hypothetical protein
MNLVERAKNLLLKPKEEWPVISGETHTVQDLYTKYVMILAAIPAVAGLIGFSLIGVSGFGYSYRIPIATGLAQMVLQYLLSLGGVYAMALIIDALAPSFEGDKSFGQALKVAAFFPTASWLAGVFYVIPALGVLAILGGIYSLWLLYLGLPLLMNVPDEKAVPYTIVVVIVTIVLIVLITVVSSMVVPGPVRGF